MSRISTDVGFLIHQNLLLTTHTILPSVTAAHTTKIRVQNGAVLLYFLTSTNNNLH
ncbi:hypothetical protein Hanom_Chr01g00009201 [Helianthus anomalus]